MYENLCITFLKHFTSPKLFTINIFEKKVIKYENFICPTKNKINFLKIMLSIRNC